MWRTVAASGVDYSVWIIQANTQLNKVYVYISKASNGCTMSYFFKALSCFLQFVFFTQSDMLKSANIDAEAYGPVWHAAPAPPPPPLIPASERRPSTLPSTFPSNTAPKATHT